MAEITEEDRQAATRLITDHNNERTHHPVYCCPEDASVYDRMLIRAIAQLRADAFTAGEAQGIERSVQVVKDYFGPAKQWLDKYPNNPLPEDAIRALSPDPDYIERERAGVWEEAAQIVQRSLDHESQQETYADGFDMPDSARWHQGRREILEAQVAALRSHTKEQNENK